MSSETNLPRLAARRAGKGCLGCFGKVSLVLLFGVVLMTAITAVFYPWAFYLGGNFHIIPIWQGWGRLHGNGGDYLVWVQFEPTPRGSGMHLESNLTGRAYLCTPRGERIPMHLGGGMPKHLHLSTDGAPIHLYMDYWPLVTGGFIADHRPSIEFRGHWQNPKLVMDDHGSIANAFQPDGTVYRGHDPNHPYSTQGVPITFAEGPRSEFDQACAAVRQ